MSDEAKEKAQRGASRLQRSAEEARLLGQAKAVLFKEAHAVRAGHVTGGYCDTEKLHVVERKLDKIIREQLEEAREAHGYSADPKFKHPEVRALELELNGLSWKPKLVVAAE